MWKPISTYSPNLVLMYKRKSQDQYNPFVLLILLYVLSWEKPTWMAQSTLTITFANYYTYHQLSFSSFIGDFL